MAEACGQGGTRPAHCAHLPQTQRPGPTEGQGRGEHNDDFMAGMRLITLTIYASPQEAAKEKLLLSPLDVLFQTVNTCPTLEHGRGICGVSLLCWV